MFKIYITISFSIQIGSDGKKHVYCKVIILTTNTYYLILKRFNFCENIIFTQFNLSSQKLICRIPYS